MSDATFILDGHEIRILDGPYLLNGKPILAAHEFAARLIGYLNEMRLFAAKRYLRIYNNNWRDEDDPILDEHQFCDRLTNPSIVLYDEIGAAIIYFDDLGMFAGHSIEVSVDEGKIAHASIVG